jgi:hypothetical protein
MADHALIVGCDAYPYVDGGDLAGAVGDALAVRAWLVDQAGVPAANVTLLASSSSTGAAAPDDLVSGAADRRLFAREIRRLVELPGVGTDDRLFVYFAGHGCRTDPQNPILARDALAFTGFSEDDPPGNAVGVQDLVARLEHSRAGSVLVLLDACRDFPFRQPFQLGGLGQDPPASGRPPPRMYLLQATLPGRLARGDRTADAIRGRFTTAVLAGLAGDGAAKVYDDAAEPPYVVRWSTLTAYLETAVADQRPEHRAGGDLVLAAFPDGHFDEVELSVSVQPADRGTAPDLLMAVSYRDAQKLADPLLSQPGPAPARWRVPPRRHRVTARAGGRWGRSAVDAYADMSVIIPLDRPEAPARPDLMVPGSFRSVDSGVAQVRITTNDPVATIEVRSLAGRTHLSGVGHVIGLLDAGQYTVILTDAGGREHHAPLEVDAGWETEICRDLPPPPGGEDRAGSLRWAGAAAAVAFGMREAAFPDVFVCLVGGDRHTRIMTVDNLAARHETGDAADPWTWMAVDPYVGRLELRLNTHRLELPAAAGLTATIDLTGARLQVAYFDTARLRDEKSLLIRDRAQRLLNAHRPEAARAVLAARTESTAVDGVLLGAHGHDLDALARERVPVEDRPHLLPGTPWAVLLDRPS